MTTDKPIYRIYLGDELLVRTDWLPIAAAAWSRAQRDHYARTDGASEAVLEVDGKVAARARVGTPGGAKWPLGRAPDLNEVGKAILLLARTAGINPIEIADEMTKKGLPTTRGRLDSVRGGTATSRSQTTEAELIVICHAIVSLLKDDGGKS